MIIEENKINLKVIIKNFCFPFLALLLFVQKVHSQEIIDIWPKQNSINVPKDAEISVQFDTQINQATFNNQTVAVHASQSGIHTSESFVYNTDTRMVTFVPDREFFYGEKVTVTLTRGILTDVDVPIIKPFCCSFIIETKDKELRFIQKSSISGTGGFVHSITAGDWNNDGLPDLAVTDRHSDIISILKNNGGLSFSATTLTNNLRRPYCIVSGDWNKDEKIDLATANTLSNDITIFRNNDYSQFEATQHIRVGGIAWSPYSLLSADFNGDGYMDFAGVAENIDSVFILLNQGDGNFNKITSTFFSYRPSYITSGDWDLDGDIDLAIPNSFSSFISVLLNDGYGNYVNTDSVIINSNPSGIINGDWDLDGDLDLAVTKGGGCLQVTFAFNDGFGKFDSTSILELPNCVSYFESGDLDADGDLDIIAFPVTSFSDAHILLNNGNGLFSREGRIQMGAEPRSMISGDWDGDGDLDLAFAYSGTNEIAIYENLNSFSIYILTEFISEASDTIKIDYSISNPSALPTKISCEYSLDQGNSWTDATILGQTNAVQPEDYIGSVLWISSSDLPGYDSENIQFKITPSDTTGLGLSDSTITFHLDNNRIPSLAIAPVEDEQMDDILIQFQLIDLESDTLDILCEYFDNNDNNWKSATVTGVISEITDYQGQIIWNSKLDIPELVGVYEFRITPYDNDPGIADTIKITIDQIGAPSAIITNEIIDEQSGDIIVNYELSDDEQDNIDIFCEYSDDSGLNWSEASITGETLHIDPYNYIGNITWHSSIDLPGVDKHTVRFKITPFDGHSGPSFETSDFHLDNNQPPGISVDSISSKIGGLLKVPFHIQDFESDTINIMCNYRINENDWILINFDSTKQYNSSNYTDTLYWNCFQDLGFGHIESVQLQLYPSDNDMGYPDETNRFDVYNFAGDYTGDMKVNYDDIVIFAVAWNSDPQDITKEIGPADGYPPLLIPEPDGKMDIEDLAVLIQQLNWSFDNADPLNKWRTLSKKKSKPAANYFKVQISEVDKKEKNEEYLWENEINLDYQVKIESINPQLVYLEQSKYDPWSSEFGDKLDMVLDTSVAVLGLHLEIDYDQEVISISDFENIFLSNHTGFTFMGLDEEDGRLILSTILLEQNDNDFEWEGSLVRFGLNVKEGGQSHIQCSWKINDQQGRVITQGRRDVNLSAYSSTPKVYRLYQNYPNPFNSSTTIRYQLPVPGKVKIEIFNILGQKVVSILDEEQEEGYYNLVWDISDISHQMASGLYFIRMQVSGDDGIRFSNQRKVLILK